MKSTNPLENLNGARLVVSWSGGKDSCMALDDVVAAGGQPVALLTMMTEEGQRSRSHGLHLSVLQAQADSLGLPLLTRPTTWTDYTDTFASALAELARQGAAAAVFGDIDIADHRAWCEAVCATAGLRCIHPLWQADRRSLLNRLFARRYEAVLVAVRDGALDPRLLGLRLDPALVTEIEAAGADACGEAGEYHTLVTAGPLFRRRIDPLPGQASLRDGCWFLDVREQLRPISATAIAR